MKINVGLTGGHFVIIKYNVHFFFLEKYIDKILIIRI